MKTPKIVDCEDDLSECDPMSQDFSPTTPESTVQPYLRPLHKTPAKRVHVEKPCYPEIPRREEGKANEQDSD